MDIHPREKLADVLRAFDDQACCRTRIAEDVPVLRRDGSVFYADIATSVLDYRGRSAVLGIFRDTSERRKAEAALRASEERFRSYFAQGLVGMAVTGIDKRWREVNDRFCEMLGYSRQELLTMKWTDATHPDDVVGGVREFERVVSGEIDHFTQDKRFVRKDGAVVHATVFIRCFRRADGSIDHFLALIEDTTQRKQAEAALRESEDRYRAVVEDQTEVICRFKADGTFTFVNDVFCRFFNATSSELIGRAWQPLALAADLPMVEKQLSTMSPDHPIVVIENRVRSGHGEIRWMQFVNRGFFDAQGRLVEVQAVGRDITDRQQAQEALAREHRALQLLLQSSDHERQLIAYEIHDGLAQQLAGAIMQFETYAYLKDKSPQVASEAFDAGMALIRQAHFETRRLISGVRPPILDEAGILPAIAHLVNEERRKGGPHIELCGRVDFDRLNPILENAIYRIVQEALNNACQHGKSDRVVVEIVQDGGKLQIQVRDHGVGFDPDGIGESHFGIAGIRERARLLGGTATIESSPGQGTRVAVELPLLVPNEKIM